MRSKVTRVVLLCLALTGIAAVPFTAELTSLLGGALFFDTTLSEPAGQSCASCHGPNVGFTGPNSAINAAGAVYEGAVAGRFGNRKPPASAYAGDSPILHFDATLDSWVGGMFWDGRATGASLGDPLAEQAQGPFLNPLEQNNASPAAVCEKVQAGPYAALFEKVWGTGSLDCGTGVSLTYERIARSIAAFERSVVVDRFSSKYDAYLEGRATLTGLERQGLEVFEGKGGCASCHPNQPRAGGKAPLFTDFTYDNLGVPKNPQNPFYQSPWNSEGSAWVDRGLGGYLKSAGYGEAIYTSELGKMKVPTLRNVALKPYPSFVKAYAHNGYFKSLADIVHFYNTRDLGGWPEPEVGENVNTTELGNLGLSKHEESALVAFLETLSDGWYNRR